jgi:hypothetical protein
MEESITKLWKDVFNYIKHNFIHPDGVIFLHNLGSFDGFLFINIFLIMLLVSTIIDDKNKFIEISYDHSIIWRDSYRIFPVSLEDGSNIYEKRWRFVGKLSKYRIEFNSLKLFNDPILLKEFIDYSIRDSIALYEALIIAQKIYIKDYNVNITTVHSTSP